jgi:hypothetical protein
MNLLNFFLLTLFRFYIMYLDIDYIYKIIIYSEMFME